MEKLFQKTKMQLSVAYMASSLIVGLVVGAWLWWQIGSVEAGPLSLLEATISAPFLGIVLLILPYLVIAGEAVRWISEGQLYMSGAGYVATLLPMICLGCFFLVHKNVKPEALRAMLFGVLFFAWLWCGFRLACSMD